MNLWKISKPDRQGNLHPIDYRWFDDTHNQHTIIGALILEGYSPLIVVEKDQTLENFSGKLGNPQTSVC